MPCRRRFALALLLLPVGCVQPQPVEPEPFDSPASDVRGVFAAAPDDIWVAIPSSDPASSGIVRYDGNVWSRVEGLPRDIVSVGGSGPDDVWLREDEWIDSWNGVRRFRWLRGNLRDGFVEAPLPRAEGPALELFGSQPDDAWAVSYTVDSGCVNDLEIWRYDGARWTLVEVHDPQIRQRGISVARDGAGRIWVSGASCTGRETILVWESGSWAAVERPGAGRPRIFMDDDGRAHAHAEHLYRWVDGGWHRVWVRPETNREIASPWPTGDGFLYLSIGTSTTRSCGVLTGCPTTTTLTDDRVLHFEGPDGENLALPVASASTAPHFVRLDARSFWMIGILGAHRIELRQDTGH